MFITKLVQKIISLKQLNALPQTVSCLHAHPTSAAIMPPLFWIHSLQIILEKLIFTQVVKKFPFFYGTRRFIAVFKKSHH